MNPDHIAWSKNLYTILSEGRAWGVPRSGLMFRKEKGKMILFDRMPFSEDMAEAAKEGQDVPASKEALEQCQQEDFAVIAAHFRAAGIEVEDNTKGNN